MKAGGKRRIVVPPALGPPVGPSTFFSAKQCEVRHAHARAHVCGGVRRAWWRGMVPMRVVCCPRGGVAPRATTNARPHVIPCVSHVHTTHTHTNTRHTHTHGCRCLMSSCAPSSRARAARWPCSQTWCASDAAELDSVERRARALAWRLALESRRCVCVCVCIMPRRLCLFGFGPRWCYRVLLARARRSDTSGCANRGCVRMARSVRLWVQALAAAHVRSSASGVTRGGHTPTPRPTHTPPHTPTSDQTLGQSQHPDAATRRTATWVVFVHGSHVLACHCDDHTRSTAHTVHTSTFSQHTHTRGACARARKLGSGQLPHSQKGGGAREVTLPLQHQHQHQQQQQQP
jgi:hypothetical protein